MPAPQEIIDLVERFTRNRAAYQASTFNETETRINFINPFFEALGWDVSNKQGHAEAYKDVYHEDAVKIGGATKAPDYSFRIGGARKFFVEAKKPSVNLKDDISPAFQVRRYAWSAKLPLSILTDFEELAVYDCRQKPTKKDTATTGRALYYTFDQYVEKWDEIAALLSRAAVLRGDFDKFVEGFGGARGTQEVDAVFLAEIERWREDLARNFALRNPSLTQRELNFAVQRTIDRIIFLRIAEDRGIEPYGQLADLAKGADIYPALARLFRRADDKYNSGLFHFKAEPGRPAPDDLTPSLTLDDKTLAGIFKSLYYPDSPYEFSVLPADILGQVYEQFLGKVIRLTAGHQAKVEEKPEVKKAGGVYYTPTYIVEYIVRQTVGRLVDGKTPDEVSQLRVLDPACGSGSFLLGAYQFLLDWHRDYYVQSGKKSERARLVEIGAGSYRLTIEERKRILLNNIYGVDIDAQAVEVTKLSLLLKVLEGENQQQLGLFQERALPSLDANIQCGNSLIGPDFYSGQMSMFDLDEDARYRINVFDWQAAFPRIMQAGGFDAVIGNPPYVRQEIISQYKDYFQSNFEVYTGTADLYSYFVEKALKLLTNGGRFSFIVANKWMRASYGIPLRNLLLKYQIEEIIDFGDLPVFQNATTYPCIIVVTNENPKDKIKASLVKDLKFQNLRTWVESNFFDVLVSRLSEEGWNLVPEYQQELINKIQNSGIPLLDYVGSEIYNGIKTGLNEAFVIDASMKDAIVSTDKKAEEIIRPFLAGREIQRWLVGSTDKYLLYITPETNINEYPSVKTHLEEFKGKLIDRDSVKAGGMPWYSLSRFRPEATKNFAKKKIISPTIINRPSFAFDDAGYFSNDKTTIIVSEDKYLLGVLNSNLMGFFMALIASTKRGGYFEYKPMYLQKLPIKQIHRSNPAEVAQHDRMVSLVEAMLALHKQLAAARTPHEKDRLQRQIEATDKQIDALVYQLYGLTDEEIKIVEGG